MSKSQKITVSTDAQEFLRLRPLWRRMLVPGRHTVFQNFELNLLAARMFAGREDPFIVCVESSHGAAIVPAVVRRASSTLRLLGEELFDYRCFLYQGDYGVLHTALGVLAERGLPLEVVAVKGREATALPPELPLTPFCRAPAVHCSMITMEQFAAAHPRLARNLRRLKRLGFEVRHHRGDYSGLLRFIYEKKAGQSPDSLFYDPLRVEFMLIAARLMPDLFEIFTLEDEASIVAALVTLRDEHRRRFYTGWFAPGLEQHSPALSLIYEVTRRSLADALDCDYMTGEQPYKLRLATDSMPLYRLLASPEQLAQPAHKPGHVLSKASLTEACR
ncbi:MAG TPA: GNAT family N-acetyltransferase [Candidatus Angelobacter sp.]|nr:GNAT family N-acetyltransferase [Candidatus Angelobacter sp.]